MKLSTEATQPRINDDSSDRAINKTMAPDELRQTRLPIWKKLLFVFILICIMGAFVAIFAEISCRIFYRGPLVTGSLIMDDPELSFRLKSNVLCRGVSPEFRVEYATDSQYGIRTEKPGDIITGSVDVVIYGDSFVFGHGVEFAQTFSSLLQKAHPHSSIINGGVFNYGPDQEFLFARRLRPLLNPTFEIACFFVGNDFSDWDRFKILNFSNGTIEAKPPCDPAGRLHRQLTASFWYPWLCNLYVWSFVKSRLIEPRVSSGPPSNSNPRTADDSNIKDIARMYAIWKKETGGHFLLVLIPPRRSLKEEDSRMAALCNALKAEDVPFLDLSIYIQSEAPTPLYFPVDQHWTASGHAMVFRHLDPIISRFLANCPQSRE